MKRRCTELKEICRSLLCLFEPPIPESNGPLESGVRKNIHAGGLADIAKINYLHFVISIGIFR